MPGLFVSELGNVYDLPEDYATKLLVVIREALGTTAAPDLLQPVDWPSPVHLKARDWLREGRSTTPPYSHNNFKVEMPSWEVDSVRSSCFERGWAMPIYLLKHGQHPVRRPGGADTMINDQDICELMVLDFWLKRASAEPDIQRNLGEQAPRVIMKELARVHRRILEMRWSSLESGFDEVVEEARRMYIYIGASGWTKAEIVFLLVAMYRTVRTLHCHMCGIDSFGFIDILRSDSSVYLV